MRLYGSDVLNRIKSEYFFGIGIL